MIKRQWAQGVIKRAERSGGAVYVGHRFERRALERMSARGEARPALGLPGVWIVIFE